MNRLEYLATLLISGLDRNAMPKIYYMVVAVMSLFFLSGMVVESTAAVAANDPMLEQQTGARPPAARTLIEYYFDASNRK